MLAALSLFVVTVADEDGTHWIIGDGEGRGIGVLRWHTYFPQGFVRVHCVCELDAILDSSCRGSEESAPWKKGVVGGA